MAKKRWECCGCYGYRIEAVDVRVGVVRRGHLPQMGIELDARHLGVALDVTLHRRRRRICATATQSKSKRKSDGIESKTAAS